MSGKAKQMNTIKQVLRLHTDGVSNRQIAVRLGLNKETVNNYVRKAKSDTLGIPALLKLEDPVLEHRMLGGHPAYPDTRFEEFRKLLPYLEAELKRPHVTLYQLWMEYRQDHPDGYGLTQFRYHYNQQRKASGASVSTVLKDTYLGGEKLFVDFAGDTLEWVDMDSGEIVKAQVFVACLPSSDYAYALAVPSQKVEDFIYALERCLRFLGGVPRILVPDNLKSAVVKAERYQPALNNVLADFADHYGCVVLPTRPRHPKDKSLVEDQVKLVYRRVYAELRNLTFYSPQDLNTAVAEKMLAHNRKRMQALPYSREEQFLAIDKPMLRPLPETTFEMKWRSELKVMANGCVYLGRDRHYYSVPYEHVGKSVQVIYTRSLVTIYAQGMSIATHGRDYRPGRYTLVDTHLASSSRAYRSRSPAYYSERAWKASPELGKVVDTMFATATVPPETFYRGCDGLLHLYRHTDAKLFRLACQAALDTGQCRYAFIDQVIKSKGSGLGGLYADADPDGETAPPSHDNIRGKRAFK
jgi:transposase